jgi:hypothetical protein
MSDTYNLISPTEGPYYRRLLDELGKLAAYCSLTVRDFDRSNHTILSFLDRVKIYEKDAASVTEWPGTRLWGNQTADLYRYKMTPDFIRILQDETSSIFSWITPNLPEDLCLYRADDSVLLATISHESDCFLNIEPDELRLLADAVPNLKIERSPLWTREG